MINLQGFNDFLYCILQRGRDSNSRYGYPHTHFPGVLLQPLGHLSIGQCGCKDSFKDCISKSNNTLLNIIFTRI